MILLRSRLGRSTVPRAKYLQAYKEKQLRNNILIPSAHPVNKTAHGIQFKKQAGIPRIEGPVQDSDWSRAGIWEIRRFMLYYGLNGNTSRQALL